MLCQVNLFYKQVGLGLRILNTFTKQVGFGSTHLAEYSWLNTARIWPTNTNCHPYPYPNNQFNMHLAYHIALALDTHPQNLGKLHVIILNYTPYYTLNHKFFEYTFYILNYDPCYTLYPDVQNLLLTWMGIQSLGCKV